jgi:two-component system, response regulator
LTRRPTILLVEDNPNDEAMAKRAMSRKGIDNEVVVTRDGAEALDYLFARGVYSDRDATDLPTVMFLDLNLPKVGGLDVLKLVRADPRTRLVPVVVLTSSSEERDVAAAYALGANSYVVKAVDFGEFSESVGQLGAYWLRVNLSPPQDHPPSRSDSKDPARHAENP